MMTKDLPDFFRREDDLAFRERARWLDSNLGVDTRCLARMLRRQEAEVAAWKGGDAAHASIGCEHEFQELWHVVLHLLSHYNNDADRVRQLFQQQIDSPVTTGPKSPLNPSWFPSSLKDFMETGGITAISEVNRWITSLRFGDPYAVGGGATSWR